MPRTPGSGPAGLTRRGFLGRAGLATAGLAAPTILPGRRAMASGPVRLGFNVPRSGPYAAEGEDQLRAFRLAVRHLNGEEGGGLLQSFSSRALDGAGILGRKVEFVLGDTRTNAEAATAEAGRMISEGAVMVTGGSSSGVAVAVQAFCQQQGVVFMAGLTHSNDTTGKDRKALGFRHFFNAYMSAAALAPVLLERYGPSRRAYHLTADYTWGWTMEESLARATEEIGWDTVARVRTPLGAEDYGPFLDRVVDAGADVIVLNHYGSDMVRSLTRAVEMGLRDRVVNGQQLEVVVPLFSELMAQGAGRHVQGILGSANWDWKRMDPASVLFTDAFANVYGTPPGQAAQTGYAQVMLYADAVQRAGSFDPCAVAEALEDFRFDGLGNGPTLYRGADHQCFKDVLVVGGADRALTEYDLLEVVSEVSADRITYPPDHPMFAGAEPGRCSRES